MEFTEYIASLPKKSVRVRQDGTCSVAPRTRQGWIDAKQLDAVCKVLHDLNLPGVRLSAGHFLQIDNVPRDSVPGVVETLGEVGIGHPYVAQACVGSTSCKMGQQDSMAMAGRLEAFMADFSLPAKLKTGVSGCPMCCAEPLIRDVGLIGTPRGWTVTFGGNGGRRVRRGDEIAKDLSEDQAVELVGRLLAHYAENGKKKERTARFVERIGLDALKQAVL